MSTFLRPLLLISLVTLGCGLGHAPTGAIRQAADGDLPGLHFRQGPVLYYDYSQYTPIAGRGGDGVEFSMDLAVRNDAYQKVVGIAWTADGWAHGQNCYFNYEGSLEGQMEKWGGSCRVSTTDLVTAVDFAAFAQMNGQEYWDSNGGANYELSADAHGIMSPNPAGGLSQFGTVERPNTPLNPSSFPALHGYGRSWPYPGTQSVGVVYTTDNWVTTLAAAANQTGPNSWEWSIPLTQGGTQVTYAAVLEVGGVQFWDNNGGANYTLPFPQP